MQKKEELTFDDMQSTMIDDETCDCPQDGDFHQTGSWIRGTSQNPDVYFQGRETVNKYYDATPAIVQKAWTSLQNWLADSTAFFDYYGHLEAERENISHGF